MSYALSHMNFLIYASVFVANLYLLYSTASDDTLDWIAGHRKVSMPLTLPCAPSRLDSPPNLRCTGLFWEFFRLLGWVSTWFNPVQVALTGSQGRACTRFCCSLDLT